jgi:Ca-activated chloride channel homolog
MRRGAVSRWGAEGWKLVWFWGLAIVVGLAGVMNVASADDRGGASDDAGSGRRSGAWANLWATREQQAQRLLESQQPAKAAALFGDPRRRAYAELQAGQYEKAAQQLAPFKDVDSQYNRGNALAHAGKLQDALAAYDAALAQSPGNSDVSRNRELVARALAEQNRGKQKANGGKSQSDGKEGQGQPGSQAPANQAEAGKPGQSGNQAQSARQAQPGNQPQQGNQAQDANPAPANQSAPGSGAQQNTRSSGSGNQAQDDLSEAARLAQHAKGADNTAAPAQGQPQAQAQTQPQSQAQALADAGQRGAANSPDRGITANKAHASVDETPPQPRSEQALALDQWLRGIPEDSGELLRRKFMIEHMMKQQGYQP